MDADKELTPLNNDMPFVVNGWHNILRDEVLETNVKVIKPKKIGARYQAGIMTRPTQFFYSSDTYATAEEAENEARRKADELKTIKETK